MNSYGSLDDADEYSHLQPYILDFPNQTQTLPSGTYRAYSYQASPSFHPFLTADPSSRSLPNQSLARTASWSFHTDESPCLLPFEVQPVTDYRSGFQLSFDPATGLFAPQDQVYLSSISNLSVESINDSFRTTNNNAGHSDTMASHINNWSALQRTPPRELLTSATVTKPDHVYVSVPCGIPDAQISKKQGRGSFLYPYTAEDASSGQFTVEPRISFVQAGDMNAGYSQSWSSRSYGTVGQYALEQLPGQDAVPWLPVNTVLEAPQITVCEGGTSIVLPKSVGDTWPGSQSTSRIQPSDLTRFEGNTTPRKGRGAIETSRYRPRMSTKQAARFE